MAVAPPETVETSIALVATGTGTAGVRVGTSTPLWTVDGAVAAPDGSAVFVIGEPQPGGGDRIDVMRVNPRTGARTVVGHVEAPLGVRVSAVEPGGRRVALASTNPTSTTIVNFDAEAGRVLSTRSFDGWLEPEAFSLDGTRLFATRDYGDYYNVHVLELETGAQFPTLGPDKTKPPEDMYGQVVQAALSPDGTRLATLYRDSTKPGRTAFVHLLFLESGATFCIDLHSPFGASDLAGDAIEWRDGRIAVGHGAPDGDAVSVTIDPEAVVQSPPQQHYMAEASSDPSPPALPAGVADTPGFERFLALVP